MREFHGRPDGTTYKVDSVYGPGADQDIGFELELLPERMTFVDVWTVKGQKEQENLLTAMKAEAPAIVSNPGAVALALLTSLDGSHIVVYAPWHSLEAFNHAIANNPTAQESRMRLAKLGDAIPNTYYFESVNLPLNLA